MSHRSSSLRAPGAAIGSGAALCLVLALLAGPGFTDDRDLLRFSASKPYLFIILDTSASMNLAIGAGDKPLIGGGDNPSSRLYAAKQALYNVFSNTDDVYFGFASFNQDNTRVRAKHYLYYDDGVSVRPAAWSAAVNFPKTDPNGLTAHVDQLNLTDVDADNDGTVDPGDGVPDTIVANIDGDVITIGESLDFSGNGNIEPAERVAGSPAAPLKLGDPTDRLKLQSFPWLGEDGSETTTIYLATTGPARTWRLTATLASGTIGDETLGVTMHLQQIDSSGNPIAGQPPVIYTPTLRRDIRLGETVMVDGDQKSGQTGGNAPAEAIPNLWPAWSPAITQAACDSAKPFSGKGWEGNYDSGDTPPAGVAPSMEAGYPRDDDKFCIAANNCIEIKPVEHTVYDTTGTTLTPPNPALGRPLDKGDMLPFDWADSQRDAFMRRLSPLGGTPPEFGVAKMLAPVGTTGYYGALSGSQAPLIGVGNTPLGKAILDFRCWYLGKEGTNGGKCKDAATFTAGWHQVACTYDPEYGCRKPYLILISDGADNCPGENPTADVAALNSHSGIKTWALNLGAPNNKGECATNSVLHSITTSGNGECVMVSSPEALAKELQNILGEIREEARSFASAAVPSVQAVADQAIYLTNFTPLNNQSRWPGHVNAFLKPLPLTVDGRPDTACKCGQFCASRGQVVTDGCFAWDAAEVLAGNPNADPAVPAQSERFLRYGRQSTPGLWGINWRELDPTDDSYAGNPAGEEVRYDLWRGFGLIPADTATDSLPDATEALLATEANGIIDSVRAPRTRATNCNPQEELCTYLLGDIFHSDPLVLGQPGNIEYYRRDLGAEFNPPSATCGSGGDSANSMDRGYRCFFSRHQYRRQLLLIGSNDGMVHAFNAAQFQSSTGRYDNGSGHEIFGYMPRAVMPAVAEMQSSLDHQFTVDGAVAAGDVFIDPLDDGATFPNENDRRWRTVAIGGLREGGRGYYALDITQPDHLDADFFPEGDPDAASCLANHNVGDCGVLPYGAPLWEFMDNTDNALFTNDGLRPTIPETLDEDANGLPDLGYTWSAPDFARIAVCNGSACTFTADPASSADVEQRFVVVFGGGMDPEHKSYDPRDPTLAASATAIDHSGHWLYMVDVETGTMLYKRQLCSPYAQNSAILTNPCIPGGAVPSQVSAVDTDLNGFVDRIYVGSVAGFMYRVDLAKAETLAGVASIRVPGLSDVTVNAIDASGGSHAYSVRRIAPTYSDGSPAWRPEVIFDANWEGIAPTAAPRPIFFRPATIFNPAAGGYALAFGTGDREDLWNANDQTGRFYLFMDDSGDSTASGPALPCGSLFGQTFCPRTENDFDEVLLDDADTNANTLLTERGWFLELPANERVITDAFSFLGITFFSSFVPTVAITDANGDPLTKNCGDKKFERSTDGTCSKIGNSNLFLVNATNGNGLLLGERSRQVSTFVTNPFTEFSGGGKGQTGDTPPEGQDPTRTADDLSETDKAVMDLLKDLFPDSCRFVNARVDIKTVAADTTLQKLASIPICLTGHSWKEF